jgi:cold shock CspA family protein
MPAVKSRATVRFFRPREGYGFADRDDGSGAIFVGAHALAVAGVAELHRGAVIAFDVKIGRSGKPEAEKVELVASQQGDQVLSNGR